MEVWIHPSLRIKALGLTPSSRIQLPGQFQSSLSPTLGKCFITFYTAWHILRWDMQNPLVKIDCLIDTFSATISLGYTPLRYLTVSLTESRLLFRIALPNAASPPPTKSHIPWCSPVHGGYVIVVECTNARVLYFTPQYPRWESNP